MAPLIAQIVLPLIGSAIKGGMRVSKTKVAAHAGGLNAIIALWPAASTGDPQGVSQFVAAIVLWGLVLWGRGNK